MYALVPKNIYLYDFFVSTLLIYLCSSAHVSKKKEFTDGLAETAEWYRQHPAYWSDLEVALLPHPGEKRSQAATHSRYQFPFLRAARHVYVARPAVF